MEEETTAKLIKVEFYLTSFDGAEWNKEEMEIFLQDSLGGIVFVSEYKDKDINYKRLIQSMAIVHTLIETFITSDDGIYDMFEEVRDKYIEKELGKSDNIPINIKKRMAYLQQYKKL